MRSPVNHALPLALIAALIGPAAVHAGEPKPAAPINGPAADYPVVVGPPFEIDGKTYTPEDKLNYDAVGQAILGTEGAEAVSAAHKTLPLPSYAEVTSLDSGRTILVRVERRGPMANDRLIELSPGAAAQLGLSGAGEVPVRVRRVNPPEQERAMLRAGGRAPERMATPKGLLDALNRKLASSAPAPAQSPPVAAAETPKPEPKPESTPVHAPAQNPTSAPSAQSSPPPTPTAKKKPEQASIVQVAAFSTKERAASVAAKLGGFVSAAGRFWRVRLGPFTARPLAEAALAKAKGAGYSDARIQRAD